MEQSPTTSNSSDKEGKENEILTMESLLATAADDDDNDKALEDLQAELDRAVADSDEEEEGLDLQAVLEEGTAANDKDSSANSNSDSNRNNGNEEEEDALILELRQQAALEEEQHKQNQEVKQQPQHSDRDDALLQELEAATLDEDDPFFNDPIVSSTLNKRTSSAEEVADDEERKSKATEESFDSVDFDAREIEIEEEHDGDDDQSESSTGIINIYNSSSGIQEESETTPQAEKEQEESNLDNSSSNIFRGLRDRIISKPKEQQKEEKPETKQSNNNQEKTDSNQEEENKGNSYVDASEPNNIKDLSSLKKKGGGLFSMFGKKQETQDENEGDEKVEENNESSGDTAKEQTTSSPIKGLFNMLGKMKVGVQDGDKAQEDAGDGAQQQPADDQENRGEARKKEGQEKDDDKTETEGSSKTTTPTEKAVKGLFSMFGNKPKETTDAETDNDDDKEQDDTKEESKKDTASNPFASMFGGIQKALSSEQPQEETKEQTEESMEDDDAGRESNTIITPKGGGGNPFANYLQGWNKRGVIEFKRDIDGENDNPNHRSIRVRMKQKLVDAAHTQVYRALDVDDPKIEYALKRIEVADDHIRVKCEKECIVYKLLSQHENYILPLLGTLFVDQYFYMLVPHMPHTLQAEVDRRMTIATTSTTENVNYDMSIAPWTESAALKLFHHLLHGVGVMHEVGYSHRDLNLRNIRLPVLSGEEEHDHNVSLRPILTGFGSTSGPLKRPCETTKDIMKIAQEANQYPCMAYRPPELFPGALMVGHADLDYGLVDVWSCGCILFSILFGGYSPFECTFLKDGRLLPSDMTQLSVLGEVPRPTEGSPLAKWYSEDILNLIDWMLEKDRSKRPSLQMVHDRVESLLSTLKEKEMTCTSNIVDAICKSNEESGDPQSTDGNVAEEKRGKVQGDVPVENETKEEGVPVEES